MIADPKEELHRLVDALPEGDVPTARRVLEALAQLAAPDGEAGIEARTGAAAPPHGTTRLEDYFDFSSPDEIRIQGHRIWIEHVLYEYIHRSRTPEQIAQHFETLTLDEIYATILYYLRNRDAVSDYMTRWLEHGRQARAAQEQDPAFQRSRERLRQKRAELLASRQHQTEY